MCALRVEHKKLSDVFFTDGRPLHQKDIERREGANYYYTFTWKKQTELLCKLCNNSKCPCLPLFLLLL